MGSDNWMPQLDHACTFLSKSTATYPLLSLPESKGAHVHPDLCHSALLESSSMPIGLTRLGVSLTGSSRHKPAQHVTGFFPHVVRCLSFLSSEYTRHGGPRLYNSGDVGTLQLGFSAWS